MFLGIGSPIPEICNLPGQGGAIEVSLDYPSAAVCNDAATQSPSQALPSGGVFSASPSGLNINTSTGVITPTGSTPATYTITYTVSGESSSFTFTINPIQQSTFSYSSSSLEQYGTASPIFASGTTTGGTFSATSGLVINTTTGVLDLANSTIGGPYTVTYTTPGPCATSSTFNVSVTALSTSLVDNNFALSFDASSNQYIEALNNASLAITDNLTLSCWVNADNVSATNSIIDKFYDGTDRSYMLRITATTVRLTLGNTDGSSSIEYRSTATLSNNVWYHIATTFSSVDNEVKIYINGSLDSTHSKTDLISSNNEELRIGTGYNLLNYFDGDIDEVAIWNRALDATDVQRIYNGSSTPGKAANLFSTGLSNGLVYWNRMGD